MPIILNIDVIIQSLYLVSVLMGTSTHYWRVRQQFQAALQDSCSLFLFVADTCPDTTQRSEIGHLQGQKKAAEEISGSCSLSSPLASLANVFQVIVIVW